MILGNESPHQSVGLKPINAFAFAMAPSRVPSTAQRFFLEDTLVLGIRALIRKKVQESFDERLRIV